MRAGLYKKILCGLWYIILIAGLNSVLSFMDSSKLILIFLLFILVDLVVPKFSFVLKIIISLLIVHRSYYIGSFLNPRWLSWLSQDVGKDLLAISKNGLTIVEPVTAMVLTLTVVVLMQTLFSRMFFRGQGITIFLCLGAALLASVHVWQGQGSAWYTVFFVTLGLIIKATVPLGMSGSFPIGRWLRILLVWILALISVAGALPQPGLDLSDWMSNGLSNDPFGPYRGMVGYSAYDGILGGPLIEDETPALRVKSPVPLYLKGETKWYYTGKGWSAESVNKVSFPQLAPKHLQGKEIEISVEILAPSYCIFTPRYPLSINLHAGEYGVTSPQMISGNPFPYEYYTYNADLYAGDKYSLTVLLPEDDPDYLRQLSNTDVDFRYLSLANVSDRVQQLALSLVQEEQNGYDKAVALASFLRYGDWNYSLDTPATPPGEDFVEYFLFNQTTGYCVHFSTAFVLMARSVGLPARWVKGYSYGNREEDGSYLIRNNDAHSWAEVWFDGYGWIPFEPTPGGAHLRPEVGVTDPDKTDPIDPLDPSDKEKPEPDPGSEKPEPPTPGAREGNWRVYAAGGTGLVILVTAVLLLWRRSTRAGIRKLYAKLQARLRIFGWQRRKWETPREHLNRVDCLPDWPRLAGFVYQFEDSVYGGAEEPAIQKRHLGKRYTLLGLLFHRLTNTKGHSHRKKGIL